MTDLLTSGQPTEQPSPSSEELRRLRLAVEASGEVIFMTDPGGTITYVNPEFVRVYGYRPSEVVGVASPRLLKSGAMTSEEYAAFWQQLMANRVVNREFVNRTKSGSLVHVEGSANPIFNNDQLVGFLAVQRDVTARKATEAALHNSEQRYRTLAEAAHDSIFIVNDSGEIEYANNVSLERFGVRGADVIGRPLGEVFPAATANEMWRELSVVFTTGKRQYFETRFDTPTGDLWLGSWLVPMPREGPQPHAVMGVARDISERKQLEQQFLQAQKMEAIGQLTGGIAHDFNNLLTAILGYSELLFERLQGDPELAADVEQVQKAGERATRLIRQLLLFSRRQATTPIVLDLNEVVAELHKMLARVINEDIHLDIAASSPVEHVRADAGQIEQLILNLVVNARDAMPAGGTLRIDTATVELDAGFLQRHNGVSPGRYVSLAVQDTGCGMTADVLGHVFEPFFTTKPAEKGTGLGLATVYSIVKQNGGCITIDSAPGEGTTVTTYLPVAEEEAPAAAAVPVQTNLIGTETILLVEDEPDLRRLMQRTLERYGYTVISASSGADAVEIAARCGRPIDLLLTDVVMPGLSGPDLAEWIARLYPSSKRLYVSGFANLALADRATSNSLLAKPFTPHTLAVKIRECLDVRVAEARIPEVHVDFAPSGMDAAEALAR